MPHDMNLMNIQERGNRGGGAVEATCPQHGSCEGATHPTLWGLSISKGIVFLHPNLDHSKNSGAKSEEFPFLGRGYLGP